MNTHINPPSLPFIGILGSGQLAAMMARAYQMIGGRVAVYAECVDTPAGQVADEIFLGAADDLWALTNFFDAVDIVTLENEFFTRDQLADIAVHSTTPVYPEPDKYGLIEDKLSEKQFFEALGLPVAPYLEITQADQLPNQPGFLKVSKGGYDGIGTYRVEDSSEARLVYEKIKHSGEILFEHEVHYEKELSLIAVSGKDQLVFYPMVETHQEQGTCRFVSYPSGVPDELEKQAREIVNTIMLKLDTRGVYAFEFFLTSSGQLVLNESAPRPHNSGHITLDLFNSSQFENHMRAVAGMLLKQPVPLKKSALMLNLLATREGEFDAEKIRSLLSDSQLSVELYGKRISRPKRKMGHINLWGSNQWQRAQQIINRLEI